MLRKIFAKRNLWHHVLPTVTRQFSKGYKPAGEKPIGSLPDYEDLARHTDNLMKKQSKVIFPKTPIPKPYRTDTVVTMHIKSWR